MASTTTRGSLIHAPVLLLKSKSTPIDAYEQLLSTPRSGLALEPIFIPVLEHAFERENILRTDKLLRDRKIGSHEEALYGGLIFTSQRAVEALSQIIKDDRGADSWHHLEEIPVYSVGPATTRALRAVSRRLKIFGEHTGTGDALGQFILEHYGQWYRDRQIKPPLLFLVGEKHSDSIPKMLMNNELEEGSRIRVDEVIVYKTEAKRSFKVDFRATLDTTNDRPKRWVVVFSPTGCYSMLEELGLLDKGTGKATGKAAEDPSRQTLIATIGPTTRDHLRNTFNFEPDVCANAPSAEGIWDAIAWFMRRHP